ncbi:MAG: four helix bundle protein [Candidatus Buchananbacteria bacterium]|nr:four helix bundle protein [Candidatus Buchananbacteria bacterium]
MNNNKYIKLEDLDIYKIARNLSKDIWDIYQILDSEQKYLFGRQLVRSTDSMGANIAEGYGRYYYLDKVRFYYNARASLFETKHWNELFFERNIIDNSKFKILQENLNLLNAKLNNYITETKKNAKT